MTTNVLDSHVDHHAYDAFLVRVNNRLLSNTNHGVLPLFTTDAGDLWDRYLDSFADPAERQYHNCHACRHFIQRFGGLVTIGDDGRTTPAIWCAEDAPETYRPALEAMERSVRKAKVTGVFLSSEPVWGTPETGVWHHLAVRPDSRAVFRRATQTAYQAMAEKSEDFKTVITALNEFKQPHLETALTLLKTDSLYRSEKVLGQAEWLHRLHLARSAAKGTGSKANVVWRAVATAPAGFCHPRSGMIGTLLEDIAAGKNYEEVSRAFATKMHPLSYQRPQAAPTAGAISAAEKVVQQLGAAGSLARRFARLEDIQAVWRPEPQREEPQAGVFGHLRPKGADAPSLRIPAQTMTWDKFQRTVLPVAERIEVNVPSRGEYGVFLTAVNADAPPILQWDREEARNPVSWYFWHGGSPATQFGLTGGRFYEVSAVTLKPSMWGGGNEHQGKEVFFVVAGARETKIKGAAIFPETLKAEFHGIRAVIEEYSRRASIEGIEGSHVVGLAIGKGGAGVLLRVWSGGRPLEYRLDRLD
jgi:hypothetical protein